MNVMIAGLERPELVWRATRPTARGGAWRELVAHAIRGKYTVCGRAVRLLWWVDAADTTPRCPDCLRPPVDGNATYEDLIAFGLTYRQVDYWCRKGWLHPDNPGCGSGRHVALAIGNGQLVESSTHGKPVATRAIYGKPTVRRVA